MFEAGLFGTLESAYYDAKSRKGEREVSSYTTVGDGQSDSDDDKLRSEDAYNIYKASRYFPLFGVDLKKQCSVILRDISNGEGPVVTVILDIIKRDGLSLSCRDRLVGILIGEVLNPLMSGDKDYDYIKVLDDTRNAIDNLLKKTEETEEIKEIKSMRKILDIMEKQVTGEFSHEDVKNEFHKHASEWKQDMQNLLEIIKKMS